MPVHYEIYTLAQIAGDASNDKYNNIQMIKKPLFKITALLFIIVNLYSAALQAGIKNIKPVIALSVDKVIISGTVKDEDGKPLENARIIFDTTEMAVTDKDGKFSFELGEVKPASHNVYFSYDNFATVVRTYYPVMGSANFNIILRKQVSAVKQLTNELPVHAAIKDTVHIAIKDTVREVINYPVQLPKKDSSQVISVTPTEELDFPTIIFKKDATALVSENKSFLDIVSEKLKNNPTVKIDIKANTPKYDPNSPVAQQRLANIVKYLIENGIAAKRLNKKIIVGGGDVNTVDFFSSESN
jgi:hypothetical protein